MTWIIGHNMPGYLPEAEPVAFREWRNARDYLREEMLYMAQGDDEAYGYDDEDDLPATEALVRAIWQDDEPEPEQEWYAIVTDNNDRAESWWLTYTDDEPEDGYADEED